MVADRDGQAEAYSADLVVVSAGAINSAALLLASASERHPGGLGNSSGVVGRHLMMHNNSSLIAFSKIPNPTRFQKTLGVNDFYFGDPDDDGSFPYPLGALQMLGKNDATLIAFDAPDAEDPVDLARHSMDFWLTTEDLPLPGQPGAARPGRPDPAAVHPDERRGSPQAPGASSRARWTPSSAVTPCCPATTTSAAGWACPRWRTRTGPCGSVPTRRGRRST